ncbi:MAG: hypothetical protein H6811_03150 [Phycisphaeraceae bacterium]|nr:hypothetical protein [Phycisphaeraceae bacterium]
MSARVAWVFSLARCGSSVIAYAAGAPWRVPVADEPFGPWDRTGPPYSYPPEQDELRRRYWDVGEHLTPEVVALAQRVFDAIAGDAGRVICKHPHDSIRPEEFASELPEHRSIFLLRNPLMRLNSLLVRGWTNSMSEQYDLPRFKTVAQRWLDHPHRFTFEEFRARPRVFFGRVWDAWGWDHSPADAEAAVEYSRSHYHASSRQLGDRKPRHLVSEQRLALPEDAIDLYLEDDFVRELMESAGWSTRRDDYLGTRPG